ncbi:BV14 family protein [Diolcogaster facetosa bracovirus]|uniref:BV14 family protein n=1 Tax=Bracoviriform facetosae TaxID=2083300 RepID=R9XNU6_9VIRU|nr:BV14 family protein [Diolcogaster facetosa bracovirus] [Bracoviriform facetosae]AGO14490.1 BV14 family protein [Diolcogaster facetosa bracovirus] [Bracoviriform facetosae]
MSLKRTLLVVLIEIIGTLFHKLSALPIEENQNQLLKNGTSSFNENGTLSPVANRTLKLPTIVYGPINQQLGNKYLSAGEGQTSDDDPVVFGTRIVYGSTTSQNNNRYMTIGQAEHVYLMVPAINEPLPISVPGLSMLQNVSTSGLIFDVNDPMGKRIENLMNTFNAFQQSFDRIVRLASPFLTDNEINLLLRKKAKDDSTRQAKEIKWLTTVASYRIKFIKLYKLLSFMYNQLKLKSKVTAEELDAAKRRKNILSHSEGKLKKITQDLVLHVLSM